MRRHMTDRWRLLRGGLCLAVAALLVAVLVRWQSVRVSANPDPAPVIVESDIDAWTSGKYLQRAILCSGSAPLRLRWLTPSKSSPSVLSVEPSRAVIPFIVLHELHVGETWFLSMLRSAGAIIMVAQERGLTGHTTVRKSAMRWLETLSHATKTHPSNHSQAPIAVGLALSAQALRVLNHGIHLPSSAVQICLRRLQIITLARRNRVKHAVSSHARNTRRRTGQSGLGMQRIFMPIDVLERHLQSGLKSFTMLECVARNVVDHLGPFSGAVSLSTSGSDRLNMNMSSMHRRMHVDYEDILYETRNTIVKVLLHINLAHRSHNGQLVVAHPLNSLDALRTTAMNMLPISNLVLPPVAKRAANSLCLRLTNWQQLCRAVNGTVWAEDIHRTLLTSQWLSSAAGLGPHMSNVHLHLQGNESISSQGSKPGDTCTCRVDGAGLVLGGSHHKTGTVLLERLLALYASSNSA